MDLEAIIQCIYDVPQMMGLLDHNPLLWQTLSVVVVVFSSYSLSTSQTKQALEPGVVPL